MSGIRLDPKQYREALKANPALRPHDRGKAKQNNPLPVPAAAKNPSKYWNVKIYVYKNGLALEQKDNRYGQPLYVFDSRREYTRWTELTNLQEKGRITDLKRQFKIEVAPKRKYRGKQINAIYYVADFCYKMDGETYVEDVKAWDEKNGKFRTTETFRIKWNLLMGSRPNICFLVLDPAARMQQTIGKPKHY